MASGRLLSENPCITMTSRARQLPRIALLGLTALAILGVITRPFKWPEAVWAVAGAVAQRLAPYRIGGSNHVGWPQQPLLAATA